MYDMKLVIALFFLIALLGCTDAQQQTTVLDQLSINTAQGVIELDINYARTDEEKRVGLMYRTNLPENEGMFFAYTEEANRTFWMKNTKIPLDIIFLDQENTIVSISKNAQPCTTEACVLYKSDGPAKYVLEVNAGKADAWHLEKGQKLIGKRILRAQRGSLNLSLEGLNLPACQRVLKDSKSAA
jgi:uncharacterized protein